MILNRKSSVKQTLTIILLFCSLLCTAMPAYAGPTEKIAETGHFMLEIPATLEPDKNNPGTYFDSKDYLLLSLSEVDHTEKLKDVLKDASADSRKATVALLLSSGLNSTGQAMEYDRSEGTHIEEKEDFVIGYISGTLSGYKILYYSAFSYDGYSLIAIFTSLSNDANFETKSHKIASSIRLK